MPTIWSNRRQATTAAEVMVAVAIMAAVIIPTWSLFVGGRGMVFKSKFTYLALLAAREEMADLRVMTHFTKLDPVALSHGWQALGGPALGRLTDSKNGATIDAAPEILGTAYTPDQARIFTKLEVQPSIDGERWTATLHVRWQEHGEDVATGPQVNKEGLTRFDFVLVRPKPGS